MTAAVSVPQLTAGTWAIDATHSTVGFTVRHLMVSKVRGRFQTFTGTITVDENGAPTIDAEIDVASITTDNAQRDGHLKTADFFEVEKFPTATFRSTSVKAKGDDFVLTGDFTLHGVTKSIDLNVEFNGVNAGMGNGPVAGFEATTTINRKDFGISIDMPLEGGGAVVGDKIGLLLEIEAGHQA
ncbi:YceI family protein [Rhodococcus sp. BP-349]|jgi:polyisoprenoid-binding protein YceI|uniref:YceI family protein n=1 Tax=unclassified Rhodococcus (in: high G+C Gram-positive bacteria) TaxID=192944 RepID=UPI000487E359|nr:MULTISPECIES: YceI family protein [unclassified Rhodococcus (in: high G+C Gram-positive bacteria)]MBY6539416.1 YceI family protein [Rhodococcus sp. BP-363]MBY6544256.1 YceI family protein [Rhodococcus sp. BP-369]MBY6563486.1 YceI family protein [Rhodococcus sp. BP-370]MBY6577778.1 YceI family protein [Rhodococcus sp. BP-364]MBY6587079.1 YceI family protein [Rhodococcus sp. BP-358]